MNTQNTGVAGYKPRAAGFQLIVVRDVVGMVPYWAADETLPKVKARFKRLSGKFPSKKASIVAFTGSYEDVNAIAVNDMGDIKYSKNLTKVEIQ